MSTPEPVPWIDFLPQQYRQQRKERRHRWRWQVVAVIVVGLGLGSVLWQHWTTRQLDHQLQSCRHQLQLCQQQAQVVQQYQQHLAQAQAQAALLAFLAHRWSRARVLDHLLSHLPQKVRLESVSLGFQTFRSARATVESPRPGPSGSRADKAPEDPYVSHLLRLASQQQARRLTLVVQGTTDHYQNIHELLHHLQTIPVLEQLQLQQVESTSEGDLSFTIQGVFRAWESVDETLELLGSSSANSARLGR